MVRATLYLEQLHLFAQPGVLLSRGQQLKLRLQGRHCTLESTLKQHVGYQYASSQLPLLCKLFAYQLICISSCTVCQRGLLLQPLRLARLKLLLQCHHIIIIIINNIINTTTSSSSVSTPSTLRIHNVQACRPCALLCDQCTHLCLSTAHTRYGLLRGTESGSGVSGAGSCKGGLCRRWGSQSL